MLLISKILPYINPQKIFDAVANRYATIFLDSQLQHESSGRYSFIGIDPVSCIIPDKVLSLQQQLLQFNSMQFKPLGTNLPPFTGGLIGYLSYEYIEQIESSVTHPLFKHEQVPDYWFGLYNQIFAFDNLEKICYILITKLADTDTEELMLKLQAIYDSVKNTRAISITKPNKIILNSNFTKSAYIDNVKKTIEYIKAGDIFEANISQCFRTKIDKSYNQHQLYNHLRFKNPAPFATYLNLGRLYILSASPERFIKISDNNVEVRPIKGTIRRDNDPQIDILLRQELQLSIKDRAENIMIVDLMRNDLSKICEANSIIVNQLCALESFTNLHHLVSVINGRLKANINFFDIIKATFPAGSISGAPKIRAMQIINELEQGTPRGISYGNIGYLGFNGNMDLSVAIRTITIYNNELSFHVGGAITLYSDPVVEYEETMLKGQKILESLGL